MGAILGQSGYGVIRNADYVDPNQAHEEFKQQQEAQNQEAHSEEED